MKRFSIELLEQVWIILSLIVIISIISKVIIHFHSLQLPEITVTNIIDSVNKYYNHFLMMKTTRILNLMIIILLLIICKHFYFFD